MPTKALRSLTETLGVKPGKIIAVHLNYASRAAERGRRPAQPSYFLKPATSLAGPGEVVRPAGTTLLGYEGEIALVIGETARHVTPEEGWKYVSHVTAANDLGLYDLRHADGGSNLRSKGGDGFTPLGPKLIEAAKVTPSRLRIRTWLGDDLVQDDTTEELLFGFGELVADLSRLSTLEKGDIILTGTPAGAGVAQVGDVLQVEVSSLDAPTVSSGRLTTRVIEGPELASWGSQPKVDPATRALAYGSSKPQLDPDIRRRLAGVAVATLTVQLRKRGLENTTIDTVHPLSPGTSMVGVARTLRFVPYRSDLFAERGGGYNPQKQAIDQLRPGEVLVMGARGELGSGTLGDLLALRAHTAGAAGIVTDGGVRDAVAVADIGMPVFAAATHPSVLGRRHVPWERDVTVACGGAAVRPGDVIVGDSDGVVVIPPDLAEEIVTGAEEQELLETYVAERIAAGEAVDGLYPPNDANRASYEHWREQRKAAAPHDSNDPPKN